MRVGVSRAFTFAFIFLLAAATAGHTQVLPPSSAPPMPSSGLMPPYEITTIVRSSGFEPLAPPLREGATYVLRATDFRGILMRVVVDAHSGAIRAVNRIVPGPGFSGPVGLVPPPYGAAGFEDPAMAPDAVGTFPPFPMGRAGVHASVVVFPPLPRPRPVALAPRNDAGAAPPAATSAAAPAVKPNAKPADVTSSATIAAPVMPSKAPAAAPLND